MLTVCENRQPGGRETNGEIRTRGALAKEGEGAQRGSRIRCLQSARYANSRRASQTGNRTTRITSRRRPKIAKLRLSRESVNYFFVSSSYHLESRLNCDYCRGPFSLSLSLSLFSASPVACRGARAREKRRPGTQDISLRSFLGFRGERGKK